MILVFIAHHVERDNTILFQQLCPSVCPSRQTNALYHDQTLPTVDMGMTLVFLRPTGITKFQ